MKHNKLKEGKKQYKCLNQKRQKHLSLYYNVFNITTKNFGALYLLFNLKLLRYICVL